MKQLSRGLIFVTVLALLIGGITAAVGQETKKEAAPVGVVKGTFFLGEFA